MCNCTRQPVQLRPFVIVESPYAATDACTLEQHLAYARTAMADSIRRGENPFASHLLLTQPGILDDGDPDERSLGIALGLAWGDAVSARVAAYVDRGITSGMLRGLRHAIEHGRAIQFRSLDADPQVRLERTSGAAAVLHVFVEQQGGHT